MPVGDRFDARCLSRGAVGIAPRGPVAAEDVRDLQSWAGHAGRLRRCQSDCSLWYERRQPVQRAHDFANEVGGHLGVARCRVELGMPEQDLNHTNVDVLLQQMGGEAVAQRCGATHLGSEASSAAMWQTRSSWRVVIGLMRSRPGNIHTAGCAMRHQSRNSSNSCGDRMAKRSLRPLL